MALTILASDLMAYISKAKSNKNAQNVIITEQSSVHKHLQNP